ncbi:MAG TPA: Zn-binding domain-containing protein, partial [Thermoanaerobaculia bacterium]|nr:Zn-binding domain-containing protein [Thermoanaerobaculia bacterium]
RLTGVIATSALEMGIDVGGLDACILVGFPGSMMATWQRAGRVGREGRESVTALVALPDALDQYLLERPDEFLGRSCEPLIVSPGNAAIARRHLVCAAAELPLERDRDAEYLSRHEVVLGELLRGFELAEADATGDIHALAAAPHREVGLRGGGATHTIVSEVSGKPIGTIDSVRVMRECHPGAVYLHQGRQFVIVELDLERRRALARPLQVEFFTSPLTEKTTTILEVLAERRDGPLAAWLGRVRVTERVVGFERKRIADQERLGQEALDLPAVEFETVALWWSSPRACEETLRDRALDFMGALHAGEHAAISLFPALALCDRGDLGGVSVPFHPQVGCGAVFLYDGYEGGVGIAEAGFARLPELLGRVASLLERCSCEHGCPGCVQSPKCGNGNRPLDKAGALLLLRLLLAQEPTTTAIEPPVLDLAAPVDPAAFSRVRQPLVVAPAALPSGAGGPRRDLFDLGSLPGTGTAEPSGQRVASEAVASTTAAPPRSRRPLPRAVHTTVLFDVETKRSAEEVGGWHRLHRLGVALAVTCSMERGVFRVYREEHVRELVETLRTADLVIGFNVIRFDYPVISGYTGEDYCQVLPTLDLFEQVRDIVGERVSLDRLARETLGAGKSGDGLQSLAWYREGRFDLIEEYCRRDVELLRDLYLFGRREGYVLLRDDQERVIRVPVDWP